VHAQKLEGAHVRLLAESVEQHPLLQSLSTEQVAAHREPSPWKFSQSALGLSQQSVSWEHARPSVAQPPPVPGPVGLEELDEAVEPPIELAGTQAPPTQMVSPTQSPFV
jgi:hypothetical protein